jgi:hypothetical protein
MAVEIPLSSEFARYTQKTTIGGIPLVINLRWNWRLQRWIIDLADDSGNPIVNGIVLNVNTDLLAPYRIAGNGLPSGYLILFNTKVENQECGRYDLGVNCLLLYEDA